MTCIVGIAENGRVHLAGDSAAISGWSHRSTADPKVFRHRRGFLVGYTASFRLGQLLEHRFDPPPPHEGQDPHAYLCTNFTDELRETLKDEPGLSGDNRKEGQWFILGFEGELYTIASDLQVLRPAERYAAVGSGETTALGALGAIGGGGSARSRLRRVLEITSHHNIGVRGPYHFISGTGAWTGRKLEPARAARRG